MVLWLLRPKDIGSIATDWDSDAGAAVDVVL